MDAQLITQALEGLPVRHFRYFDQIDSTNDEASRWLQQDAPHLALVIADEQRQGKGRAGRRWVTRPGAALAFSLVYRFSGNLSEALSPAWLSALGGMAVSQALQRDYKLAAEIKWPNDVLIQRRKVAGVLAEAQWDGSELRSAVLGIGVNIAHAALPPPGELLFPATCVESELGRRIERLDLLRSILEMLFFWQDRVSLPLFLSTWWENLAFRHEIVQIAGLGQLIEGQIDGLEKDGALRIIDATGQVHQVHAGEVRLRPLGEEHSKGNKGE